MRIVIIILSLMLLTGCATVPMETAPLNQPLTWPQRQAQLNDIQHWQVQGVVGVHYQQQAQTANVNLTQTGQEYHLELYGPLGAERVVLDGVPEQVTMKAHDGQIITASSPEKLLQQRLGWSLPVTNLYYWLRALPAPDLPNKIKFDAYHHLLELRQQGWTINYVRYAGINDIDLPTKITMRNPRLQATIIISEWSTE